MKNIGKFLGIIAAVAVIGLAVGCGEPDPEDRIEISITGLPTTANDGFFAVLSLENASGASVARSTRDVAVKISGSTAKGEMAEFKNGSWINFADADSYIIGLEVYDNETDLTDGHRVYRGKTRSNQAVVKGSNAYSADLFSPSIDAGAFQSSKPPAANNFGTYTGAGYTTGVTETIVLAQNAFQVSDNSKAAGTVQDSLNFRIDRWEEIPTASLPADATSGGYTGGYKFTGKMTATTTGYIPSTQTAPNFTADDVKADGSGPDCWMSIYFKGETGSITFIRTPFSKAGSVNEGLVRSNPVAPANVGAVRVYTKQ